MNILKTSALTLLTLSTLTACATTSLKTEGRIIEFKSDSSGFDTRTFFYEGKNEVVAFDAQFTPELAKKSIEYLRTFTKKPITHLIITHPNPDKFNGASVFKNEGAKIIASNATANAIPGVHVYKEYFFVEMAKMFPKGQYPQPVAVDETFNGREEIVLQDGEKIELMELSQTGVSSTQTIAYIPSLKSVFVGDLIHYKAHAWLEGGIVNGKPTPAINEWILSLEELQNLLPAETTVFAGRGQTANIKTAADEQIDYLIKARKLIQNEVKGKKEFNDYKGLTTKFEKAFPTYDLSYLIEYGAYGLVNSEL